MFQEVIKCLLDYLNILCSDIEYNTKTVRVYKRNSTIDSCFVGQSNNHHKVIFKGI